MKELNIIGYAHNGYREKFGIPRQSGLVEAVLTRLTFLPPYDREEGFRGLEDFTHLWLLWGFDKTEAHWSPTVRPPRLGGNKRVGVFATRSPFRPNAIGLSSVKLVRIEKSETGAVSLLVSGADVLDGTPIYDIKPYLPYTDSHPEASNGFAQQALGKTLPVHFADALKVQFPQEILRTLTAILESDPRPSYQEDEQRLYGLRFENYEVRFRVTEAGVWVSEIYTQA